MTADAVTTLSTTLTSNNVILTINDLEGRANYNGWVSIISDGEYVNKYGKGGWISQLGKVGFNLNGNVQGVAKKANNDLIACAFITATATGQATVKAISKSDGSFTLNLTSGVLWTVSAVDPATGLVGSQTITPGGTSSNPLIVVSS